jgi:6-phosphofructokinase 1
MRTVAGRKKCVANLISFGVYGLIVIGGDGSLTGADALRAEWQSHTKSLIEDGVLNEATAAQYSSLRIVGLVGSIDNDMFGTDLTIGSNTALERIIFAIDCITSTAQVSLVLVPSVSSDPNKCRATSEHSLSK